MTTESYLGRRDIYQTVRIEELGKDKDGLTIKLHSAETEVGRLQLIIERMEDGKLALTVRLQDANNEIGRLGMVLKQREENLECLDLHH
ncbi:MAG: hypothetical protein WB870_13680 [Gallionellaceae bacterium]